VTGSEAGQSARDDTWEWRVATLQRKGGHPTCAESGLLAATLAASSATVVLAHEGGHRGGCAEFRHVNLEIARDPASFGFDWARNLGDIVSWFATDPGSAGR
jgi:hypothetical protein